MTPLPDMLPFLGAVFVASITGSVHCAGMCGPLAVVACGSSDGTHSIGAAWSYQFARGASYAVVGGLAGVLGSLTECSGELVGAQHIASMLAGVTLASVGLIMLLRLCGAPLGAPQLPRFVSTLARAWHLRAMRLSPRARAISIGAATPLLPCGWLWAFAVVAAGTASAWGGALVMIAFWLGSVPAVAAVVYGARIGARGLGRFVHGASAILLVAVGIEVAWHRASLAAPVAKAVLQADERTLHAALPQETPACCRAEREEAAP